MRKTGKVFLSFLFGSLVLAGSGIAAFGASARTVNLPDATTGAEVDDDYVPDVTARVARISFIRGEAKIRRSGNDDWETATLNLPIVEGDDIVTNAGARLEIQFDKYQHLRLDENAYLKLTTLQNTGIAVSISLGTMSLKITSFDKERSYFEIDAPKTTLAVQRAGAYRVDAGKEGDTEVRVAANGGGEARVYSDNAGFTLKNGRSARIYLDGANAGEWETAEASRYADEFDEWALDRDSTIAKRLKDAYYDTYYDNDIYGADDLDGYGQWVHTRNYGYVWRPYRTSLSRYADWSPYRYGHWRWMPPYGWIWVNDEPWGWATYHHGRWFWDDGYWNWSPYGYYRTSHSWWYPALVVINIFSNNICWYPQPYHYGHYNYNSHYNNNHNGGHYNNNNQQGIFPTGGVKPIPVRTPAPAGGPNGPGLIRTNTPPLGVPASAVVATTVGDFGTNIKGNKKPPLSVANAVIAQNQTSGQAAPIMPVYTDVKRKISRDIVTEKPLMAAADVQVKTGAGTRKTAAPLDNELRTTKVFGGRPPLTNSGDTGGIRTSPGGLNETRKTGAVEHPPVVKQPSNEAPIRVAPVYSPPVKTRDEVQNEPVKTPRYDPPVKQQPPAQVYNPPPRNDPPPQVYNPPPPKPTPRNDPPPKSEPKSEPLPDRSTKKAKDGS